MHLYQLCMYYQKTFFNPLSANPTKWSNTFKQFVGKLSTNCLSVFDHFVKLALKGLIVLLQNLYMFANLLSKSSWLFFINLIAVWTLEYEWTIFSIHILKTRLAIFAFTFVKSLSKISSEIWLVDNHAADKFYFVSYSVTFCRFFRIGTEKFMYFSFFSIGTRTALQTLLWWNRTKYSRMGQVKFVEDSL